MQHYNYKLKQSVAALPKSVAALPKAVPKHALNIIYEKLDKFFTNFYQAIKLIGIFKLHQGFASLVRCKHTVQTNVKNMGKESWIKLDSIEFRQCF